MDWLLTAIWALVGMSGGFLILAVILGLQGKKTAAELRLLVSAVALILALLGYLWMEG